MTSVSIDAQTLRQTVDRARTGCRVAADRLARDHEGWVRSAVYAVTGRPDLVDDIAQQVWARVWERLDTLDDPQRLRSWLYTIARHTALDFCEAHRRQQTTHSPLEAAAGAADRRHAGPFDIVARGELRHTLLQAVRALPAIYREPFVLRHLEDWSYGQIGEVLGLPAETVETRLVRARRMLREMLMGRAEAGPVA